jgi:methionine aminopeptidase
MSGSRKIPRFIKIIYLILVNIFALIGLVFIGVFFAIRLKVTDVSGTVDNLNQQFQTQSETLKTVEESTTSAKLIDIDQQIKSLTQARELKINNLCALSELSYIAPQNVKKIITIQNQTNSDPLISQMLFAVETHLTDHDEFNQNLKSCLQNFDPKTINIASISAQIQYLNSQNIFSWPDKKEWADVAASITKDKNLINQAASAAQIEPRLVVSNLMVEQLRLFYSQRELYKKYFEPLQILANSNKISLGVMAIKEETATAVEAHLKDPSSPYYLGPEFEHLLDYPADSDIATVRYQRLTSSNHYYNYLYGALYLKQMMTQWQKAGFDISHRPEIIGTLFNVGFPQSKPNANPQVGGSTVLIDQTNYTFGRLAYEFYYSGELDDIFPYTWVN